MDALLSLEKNREIVIKTSDKGGNIVVMTHHKYKKMCLNILSDQEGYEILPNNPILQYKKKLEKNG